LRTLLLVGDVFDETSGSHVILKFTEITVEILEIRCAWDSSRVYSD
jgi:hypothetical protein